QCDPGRKFPRLPRALARRTRIGPRDAAVRRQPGTGLRAVDPAGAGDPAVPGARRVPAARRCAARPARRARPGTRARTRGTRDMSPRLQVEDLRIALPGRPEAIGPISFSLEAGRGLGIVGESGSGKSLALLALLDLLPPGARAQGRLV